jgi:ADP-heptose:LPS heptosyltransferase
MKILIAPFAARLPEDRPNAKNFPHWQELVALLNADNHEVVQIGLAHEPRVEGVAQFIQGWPLDKLIELIRECDCWVSVDSFLPHLCATERLPAGVVIWAQSDPRIWGYPHNVNLLKSRDYLRQWQYAPWYEAECREEAFIGAEVVRDAIYGRLTRTAAA